MGKEGMEREREKGWKEENGKEGPYLSMSSYTS